MNFQNNPIKNPLPTFQKLLNKQFLVVYLATRVYSKTSNNRTGGADNEYRGGPGGPGTGFYSPGGVFFVLVAVVACHYVHSNRPRDYKNQYQDHQNHPCTRYQPPTVRLLDVLEQSTQLLGCTCAASNCCETARSNHQGSTSR